jgi:hypothetical protein
MCDSYIGLDVKSSICIDVKKRPEAAVADDESDDDSNTEEEGTEIAVVLSSSAQPCITEEEEEEGYWYYLGGANIWEGLLHLFLIYIIALLFADILESRGYISWNPFKSSSRADPRFSGIS